MVVCGRFACARELKKNKDENLKITKKSEIICVCRKKVVSLHAYLEKDK